MANIKITDLNNFADPNSTDVLPIVDVANDETKKVSIGNLMKSAVAGTAALPGVAFAVDEDTGMYRNASDQLAFATGGVERILIDDNGDVTISGSLTVNGTTTTIDSTTLTVEDKNIELGVVDTPSDTTADGGGITLKGATDKTLNWVDSTDSWTSSENVDLASGKTYKIAGTDVLSGSTLGSGVTGSSLTSVGTITTGVWNGTALTADAIGADAINGDKIADDSIDSEHYVDGSIDNVHVSASAAIAGTKISPDFGAQDLTVDTNVLHVSATSNHVGIGTTNAGSADLAIVRARDVSNYARFSIGQNVDGQGSTGGNHLGLWYGTSNSDRADIFTSAGNMNFWVDGAADGTGQFTFGRTFSTTWMTIDDSGRVGVGTASPDTSLEVEAPSSNTAPQSQNYPATQSGAMLTNTTQTDGVYTALSLRASNAGGTTQAAHIYAQSTNSGFSPELHFSQRTGSGTSQSRMVIDSSGRLLVGTNSAAQNCIAVFQGNNAGSDGAGIVHLAKGSTTPADGDFLGTLSFTDSGHVQAARVTAHRDGGTWTSGSSQPTRLAFSTTADGASSVTERMRISSDGNIMIGDGGASEKLEVEGNAILDATDATLKIKAGSTGTTGALQFTFNTDSTVYGGLDLNYDNRATDGVRLFTGSYPITIEFDEGDYFRVKDTSTEYLRVDSSGRLLVGTASAVQTSSNSVIQAVSDTGGYYIAARNDTSVTNNNAIGGMRFYGNDSDGNYDECARIECAGDGTHSNDSKPSRLGFFTTADGSASTTERMRIDSSGRVLVGTTSDQSISDDTNALVQIFTAAAGKLLLGRDDSTVTADDFIGIIDFHSTDGGSQRVARIACQADGDHAADDKPGKLVFSTTADGESSPTARMTIDSAGQVGIGDTNPEAPLHIGTTNSGNSPNQIFLENLGQGNNTGSTIFFRNRVGTAFTDCAIEGLGTATNNSALLFLTENGSGTEERARIDSSGRLLVGTSTNIGTGTDNRDSLNLVSAAGGGLLFGRNDTTTNASNNIGRLLFYGNDSDGTYEEIAAIRCTADDTHSSTSKPTRFTVDLCPSGSDSPTERIRLEEDGQFNLYTNTNLVVRSVRTSASESAFVVQSAATTTLAGTTELVVYADGDVENTNNRYTQLSDERFKENIVDANSQWDDIKAVRVRNFNFKEETGRNTHTQLGVVAQEIELTSPGLVTERRDPDSDETHKSVAYSVLYMKAVKALQEAMDRIETLEAKVAALEAG